MNTTDRNPASLDRLNLSSIAGCNGILETMSLLNAGADHDCAYVLEQLQHDPSLDEAVASHFQRQADAGAKWAMEAGKSPKQIQWAVRLDPLGGDWKSVLEQSVARWFFGQAYSPKTSEMNQANVVLGFMNHLAGCVGSGTVFEVSLSDSMWPEVAWEGYAFANQDSSFLLHFGFSD